MLEYTWTSKGEQMIAYNYIKWEVLDMIKTHHQISATATQ